MKKFLWIFFFLVYAFVFTDAFAYKEIQDLSELKILTPSLKNRKTGKIRLKNGLTVYLISDENADQSAAAMAVNAGSWQDKTSAQGIAHLVEHMLFMGTKKYPKENDFMQFITDHSGKTNAFTTPDRTVYLFSINHDAFHLALDRFAHFFTDPLFMQSSAQNELQVVNQEFEKNLENDDWRLYMIMKQTGNSAHPNKKFSTGNINTLSHVQQKDLQNWFESNYSANLMHLVIYSPLPLEELKEKTAQIFEQIPNRDLVPFYIKEPLSSDAQRGHTLYAQPVKNLQKLYLEWELPKFFTKDESKAADFLAYTLMRGHKQNLQELLKTEKLAEKVSARAEQLGSHHASFQLEVHLTDLGLEHISTVIERCFESLQKIKKGGIPPYLFYEMQKMTKLKYEYQPRRDAFEYVQNLVYHLVDEDISTFPQKTVLASQYDSRTLQTLLSNLTPNQCQFIVLADEKKVQKNYVEKEAWMEGKYVLEPVSKKLQKRLRDIDPNPYFTLPPPNPFIPTHLKFFEITKVDPIKPVKLIDNENATIFYFREDEFQTPSSACFFHIRSHLFDESTQNFVLTKLYLESINKILAPIFLNAHAAGIDIDMDFDKNLLSIQVKGFSEKLSLVMEEIFKEITHISISQDQFENFKTKLLKDYQNHSKDLHVSQANETLKSILCSDYPSHLETIQALKEISYDQFIDFIQHFFQLTSIEGIIAGNLSIKDAESIWTDIKHLLDTKPLDKKRHIKRKIFALPEERGPFYLQYFTKAKGNGAILLLDEGDFSFEKRASQEILSVTLKEAFFDTLRTKQKTAYIAQSKDTQLQKRLFQIFAVQSSTHAPLDLLYRFEFFIEDFLQNFSKKITQERFEKIKENQIIRLKTLVNSFDEKMALIDQLLFEYNDLDWIEKRIAALKELSYEKFFSLSHNFLTKKNKKRLAILVQQEEENFSYQDISKHELVEIGEYRSSNVENLQKF